MTRARKRTRTRKGEDKDEDKDKAKRTKEQRTKRTKDKWTRSTKDKRRGTGTRTGTNKDRQGRMAKHYEHLSLNALNLHLRYKKTHKFQTNQGSE
jgi:hypothetical protein